MKKNVRRICAALFAAAVLLPSVMPAPKDVSASLPAARTARGEVRIVVTAKTEIAETEKDGKTYITVKNAGEANAFVRIGIFAGPYAEVLPDIPEAENGLWRQGKEEDSVYWYYGAPLAPGAETQAVTVSVITEEAPAYDFDIAAVQESVRAAYSDGMPLVPDAWDVPDDFFKTTGGNKS